MEGRYYTDPKTRKAIDSLLQMNAAIQANLGTNSKFDIKNPAAAEQLWHQWLVEIKVLDPIFFKGISTAEEKEMVTKKIYSKQRFREQQAESV